MKNLNKIAAIILIILICLVSFWGIYVKKVNKMENILPEYKLSMDFSEKRITNIHVNTGTTTVYYDADKNVIDEEVEDGSSEEIPINPEEVLNKENYEKSKEIIKTRMDMLGANEYYIRQDENGYIVLEFPEETVTDSYIYTAIQTGLFEVKDSETDEVFISNESIEKVDVVYNTTETGTTVYLSIQLDKEASSKLEEISKTYVQTTDEEGNTTTKNITISIDDATLVNSYFGQTISNGLIQIPVGTENTNLEIVNENYQNARIYEAILESGKLPIVYELGNYQNSVENTYTNELAILGIYMSMALLVIIMVWFIIRYKANGIIASILEIGLIASLLLVIRLTNCVISINGIIAILIIAGFQFAFINTAVNNKVKYLKDSKKDYNEIFTKYMKLSIPIDVIAILYTFVVWTPIGSMGAILFWGMVLFAVYNVTLTKVLITKNEN